MEKRRSGEGARSDSGQPAAAGEGPTGDGATGETLGGGRPTDDPSLLGMGIDESTADPGRDPEPSSSVDAPSEPTAQADAGDAAPAAPPTAVAPEMRRLEAQPPQRSSSAHAARPTLGPLHPRLGREALGVVVLVLLALVCAGLIAAVVLKTQSDAATAAREAAHYTPPPQKQTPAPGSDGPVIAVVGDESVTSTASGVSADARWTTLLGDRLDAQVVPIAASRQGYTVRSSDGDTFVEAAATVPTDASVVLFVGGAADADASSLLLARAATQAFAAAADRAPDASIVAIGPLFIPSSAVPGDLADVRSALQGAARIADVRWVDPVRSKWLAAGINSSSDLGESAERVIGTRLRIVVEDEID